MGLMWPVRTSANPSALQAVVRMIHYAGAAVGVFYVGKMIKYLYDAHGTPDWGEVAKLAMLGAGIFLGARAFRFVVGKE
jgi:hypothetical protein